MRHGSDQEQRPLGAAARRRVLRALISALAGGGLTAAGLAGPLAGTALAEGTSTASESQTSTTQSSGSQETTTTSPQESTTSTTTTTSTTSTTPAPPTSTTSTTTTTTTTTSAAPPAESPKTSSAPTTQTTSTPSTTTTPAAPAGKPTVEAPVVILPRKRSSGAAKPTSKNTSATSRNGKKKGKGKKTEATSNNVAASPETVADAAALEAILSSSDASDEALQFYRIPLFLLPIYKAAAVQYGVPWQVLAAINEVETNYGTDLAVSSAGAIGWMQFMPSTWLQYGVDALNAGYADPYNPVDAIFAAARYLRAAGAASNLREAIFAYNHSEEYVDSVLLRARLIATYPNAVIATLTGLVDGRLPVTGNQLSWSSPEGESGSSSSASATGGAVAVSGGTGGEAAGSSQAATPGSSPAPSPEAAAANAKPASASRPQLDELTAGPHASVIAVQDGRVVAMGHSSKLGAYIVLKDVYGDVFTYADLGSIATSYTLPNVTGAAAQTPLVQAASTRAPAPKQAASAGTQPPVTLHVQAQAPAPAPAGSGQVTIPAVAAEGVPAGMGRVRLYAHPDNPDARAAAAVRAAARARSASSATRQRLHVGSVVAAGTTLGRVSLSSDGLSGHLRFAIRPAGDSGTIDPGPVLANWAQLQAALHPQGARASNPLLGATASDVLLLSQSELQRAVLSDPEIRIYQCGRSDIGAGVIDTRVLAVLAFLARSGLEPTVTGLRCGQPQYTSAGALSPAYEGEEVTISAINGVPISGHQGAGTITDLAIRTLLNLPKGFVPQQILSLMRYPGSAVTVANPSYSASIAVVFAPVPKTASSGSSTAHAARIHAPRVSPLSAAAWNRLMDRVAALPFPSVATKRSKAAVSDPASPRG